ncbi:hypothetical protein BVG16_02325 [Paenibacillus selenitireducens]|uniref:Prephenate dehydratase domain-containing protein n=1 Tax=Paenibacillus selenitireducens TaxID=1324314 RepID=A0A1T2XN05_9BACL|nr:sensor histidine kinase [Paenibacillus selenitireducens]OPA81185.1 hypothetical protein BVG16_02325 [Paenibacillus selenitireducens]
MQILFVVLLLTYNVTSLLYYKRHFPTKHEHWLYYVVAVTFNLTSYFAMDYVNLPQTGVLVTMVLFMVELKLLFRIDSLQLMYGGSLYIFVLYCFREIVVSVFALILGKSIIIVLQQGVYNYTIDSIAVLATMIFDHLVKKSIAPDVKMKQLFRNRRQLKFVVILQFALLSYLMTIKDGRHIDSNVLWFTLLHIKSCLLSLAMLVIVWNQTIWVSFLLEYERHTQQLQEQLERQMRHYRAYQKYTENFRNFKHDYNNMMISVKALLKNKEIDIAAGLMDDIHDTMQKSVLVHKNYSDNVILDAILQDVANTCEEYNIQFSAMAHIPTHTALSELDIVRVFSNVLSNAIEACRKVPDISERFIEITSSANESWSCVEISNSFTGEIKLEDDGLVTTKQNKENHGFGLKILKEIIEDLGGVMLIEADQVDKKFTIKIHIPRHP